MPGPGDLAEGVELSTMAATAVLIDVIYGGITNATGISGGAQKCLAGLSKATGKLASAVQKGVGKCRDLVNKGKLALNPSGCATDNAKTVAKVNKMAAKLSSTAVKKCTDAQVVELNICGNGVGGTSTTAAASACLEAATREIGDSTELPALRNYSPGSLIGAA